MRVLLVANGIIVAAVGVLSMLFVDRPAGFVGAAGAWLFAGGLFGCLPLTDPHRGEPW